MGEEAEERNGKERTMSDLISRHDAFRTYQVKVCHDVACSECQMIEADGTCRIEAWLKDIPSADRPTGEWVNEDGTPSEAAHSVYCSRCGKWSEYRGFFCLWCGAKMGGGPND